MRPEYRCTTKISKDQILFDLPDVSEGFFLVFTPENWHLRESMLRFIFQTVSPMFQPFLERLGEQPTPEQLASYNYVLQTHGMGQIQVVWSEN